MQFCLLNVISFFVFLWFIKVQTDFQQISPTQFMITVPEADNINHLVVFLTGAVPFPDGFGGSGKKNVVYLLNIFKMKNYMVQTHAHNVCHPHSVYFSWPNPNAPPEWQLLGFLTNAKPSSIYKITKLKTESTSSMSYPASSFSFAQPSHNAQIGISIEPLNQIQSQSPNAITEPSNTSTFLEFADNAVRNLFDYVASFSVTQSQMTPNPNEVYIPMSALRNWFTNFSRKLQLNPQFWRSWNSNISCNLRLAHNTIQNIFDACCISSFSFNARSFNNEEHGIFEIVD